MEGWGRSKGICYAERGDDCIEGCAQEVMDGSASMAVNNPSWGWQSCPGHTRHGAAKGRRSRWLQSVVASAPGAFSGWGTKPDEQIEGRRSEI